MSFRPGKGGRRQGLPSDETGRPWAGRSGPALIPALSFSIGHPAGGSFLGTKSSIERYGFRSNFKCKHKVKDPSLSTAVRSILGVAEMH